MLVEAIQAYRARDASQITFRRGDKFIVLEAQDCPPGWLKGLHDDHVGFFPESYVRFVGDSPPPQRRDQGPRLDESKAKVINEAAVALRSFDAASGDEISFQKDDLLFVEKEYTSTGWSYGYKEGNAHKGRFPTAFAKIINDEPTPPSPETIRKGRSNSYYAKTFTELQTQANPLQTYATGLRANVAGVACPGGMPYGTGLPLPSGVGMGMAAPVPLHSQLPGAAPGALNFPSVPGAAPASTQDPTWSVPVMAHTMMPNQYQVGAGGVQPVGSMAGSRMVLPAGSMAQAGAWASPSAATSQFSTVAAGGKTPAPPAQLPPGYEVKIMEGGRPLYINHNNQTTSWDPPAAAPTTPSTSTLEQAYLSPTGQLGSPSSYVSPSSRNSTSPYASGGTSASTAAYLSPPSSTAAAPARTLPPGWERQVDKNTGKEFYIDHNTQSTHWELPPGI